MQSVYKTNITTHNTTSSIFTKTNYQQEIGISGCELLKTPGPDAGRSAIKKTDKHTQKFTEFSCTEQSAEPTTGWENPDLEVRYRGRVKKCLFTLPAPPRN